MQEILGVLALIAALTPLFLGFGVARLGGLSAFGSRRITYLSAMAALGLTGLVILGAALERFVLGSGTGEVVVSLATRLVRVDGLTLLMLGTVATIGAVVCRYAIRYLDGDPGQASFSQWLAFTLGSVLLLVVSGDLILLGVGWVGSALGLHQLLLHRGERWRARRAARAKFLIDRIGDVALLGAVLLLARTYGTTEISAIVERASAGDPGLSLVASLLVFAAMTKSAQFPFHGWLPESMETPTPVSALMHAGLVNAGGFLLIRMSPVLVEAPGALAVLLVFGLLSVVIGSTSMLVQTDAKGKLAYSTVSQMGFMMVQCGLGAFSAATLHLVGHALYKGHAFLSAASQVAPYEAREKQTIASPRIGAVLAGTAVGVAALGSVAWVLGVDLGAKAGFGVLGAVLLLGVVQVFLLPGSGGRLLGASQLESAALAAGIAVSYVVGVGAIQQLIGGALPTAVGFFGLHGAWVAGATVGVFLVVAGVQEFVSRGHPGVFARWLYAQAQHGFHLSELQHRIVESIWGTDRRDRAEGGVSSW